MVSSLTEFATKLRSEKVLPFVQTEGTLREVHDAITDMIKQLANEPSVGLYFVQQHVHKAVPGLVSLKTQMVDSTREVEYVTQDVKDSLNAVKSMKEVGPAVIERMIKTLDSSQPRLASLRPSKRVSSEQVPLEKHISGQSTSAGDYSGYMKTTFDSALQKASSMANVTRWKSSNKGIILNSSSGGGQSLGIDIVSEAPTESNPSLDAQDLLDTAYSTASSLRKTVSEPSTGTSTNKEKVSTSEERQQVHDLSSPVMGKTHSLLAFREISDYGKPGQYVRAVLGSARQTAENVSKEASKFLSPDGRKTVSGSDKPAEGWGWLQVPSNALRAFNKQSQTSEDLIVQEGRGNTVILNEASSSRSEEEIQQLLDSERASYEAFAAEKAAKLEEWLQDTEEDDEKTEIA